MANNRLENAELYIKAAAALDDAESRLVRAQGDLERAKEGLQGAETRIITALNSAGQSSDDIFIDGENGDLLILKVRNGVVSIDKQKLHRMEKARGYKAEAKSA